MKTVYQNKQKCCGCGCCADNCPVSAIEMEFDEEGFKFPVINQDKCINCKKCRLVCDYKNKKRKNKKYKPDTYIFQHAERKLSQSGGAFVALSDVILMKRGVVYGAIMSNNVTRHCRAETIDVRNKMRGTKYVQSDMSNVCIQIKNDLEKGRLVCFTGTPCQAAGVYNYFDGHPSRKNLYIIDVICHGVPSPQIFSEYIKFIEKKENAKVEKFNFRDKDYVGWGAHIESYMINGRYITDHVWRDIFYDNIAMRESCGICPYSTIVRKSDITIGDAWQIEKRNPEMTDSVGTSLVMIHTDKGKELLEACDFKYIRMERVDIDDYMQVNMYMPSRINKRRRKIFLKYVYNDFGHALKEYYKIAHFNRLDHLKVRINSKIHKVLYRGLKRELLFLIRKRR